MENFFKLRENKTDIPTEVLAGITTFFAMSYVIFVNPAILSQSGIPWGAVYLATILSASISTLIMGLFANVPYALAPGMGLNAFFTYTVVSALGFTWQEALAMVFICGIINILITVTRLRKELIIAIPKPLQYAISGGIGIFVGYIGLKNGGFLNFTLDPGTYIEFTDGTILGSSATVPALVNFNTPGPILALIGLLLTIILLVKNVKGAVLIGIIATTLLGIPMAVVDLSNISSGYSVGEAFTELGGVFGAAIGSEGLGSLFSDPARLPLVIITIFAFSMADTFDTIGTFIGTGRQSGIFTDEDEKAMMESKGFESKMDKALFADAIGTSMGAILGTSNTTTYVESAAGIGAGGRTGLTSIVTTIIFLLTILATPIASIVPAEATAPALIVVGIMMLSSFTQVKWDDFEEAVPAFFSSIFMGLAYNISYGMAAGFIFYCIVKIVKGKAREIHPILILTSILFILNFIMLGYIQG